MNSTPSISFTDWPRQGPFLHRRVKVCFNYDTDHQIGGRIVRDDAEEPGALIIALDDGRFVRSVECSYRFEKGGEQDG